VGGFIGRVYRVFKAIFKPFFENPPKTFLG
jgi:hypothetical protein